MVLISFLFPLTLYSQVAFHRGGVVLAIVEEDSSIVRCERYFRGLSLSNININVVRNSDREVVLLRFILYVDVVKYHRVSLIDGDMVWSEGVVWQPKRCLIEVQAVVEEIDVPCLPGFIVESVSDSCSHKGPAHDCYECHDD